MKTNGMFLSELYIIWENFYHEEKKQYTLSVLPLLKLLMQTAPTYKFTFWNFCIATDYTAIHKLPLLDSKSGFQNITSNYII